MWQPALGLLTLVGLSWLLGERRGSFPLRTAAAGLGLQILLALFLLKLPVAQTVFLTLNKLVLVLESATRAGTSFVFGYLGGGPTPFEAAPGSSFILAFQALPLVLLISALSALLFHWGILQPVVRAFSFLLQKSLGLGGALGLSAAANVFVGMIEAPLLIRPYLKELTRGELFAVMTCGMTTIAGTMMVLYAGVIGQAIPGALSHILIASLISAPAAITVAAVMIPRGGATLGEIAPVVKAGNAMEAVVTGTLDGLKLLLNIIAMLVVFVALVNLFNQMLALLPDVAEAPLTLERALGWAMAPVVWLMGIPWSEAPAAGALMGMKTILNEFIAYLSLAAMEPGVLSDKSRLIMTYALCGFANFGSVGIMIGGLAAMAPERREEIVSLGLKSLVAGTIGTCMTGAVVGLVL